MNTNNNNLSSKLQQFMFYLIIVLLPIIITFSLISIVLDSNITQYHPLWTDEVDYWTQINSFRSVGFNSGYFSINELTSHSSFSHYGTHGPMFPFLYGNLARLFGWEDYSGLLFNMFVLSLSLLCFLLIIKPNTTQSIFTILIFLFSYYLILYLPTTMQESLHFAFAIVFSAFFIRLFIVEDTRTSLKIGIILIVFLASLVRIIWIFSIFPVFMLIINQKKQSVKRIIISIGLSLLFSLVISFLYIYWTSPYPEGNLYQLMQPGKSLFQLGKFILSIATTNFQKLIGTYPRLIDNERYVRLLYLLIILFLIINIKKQVKTITSILFIITSPLLLTILLYDIGNFRVIAPFLIFALLVMGFIKDPIFVKNTMTIFIIMSLFSLPLFFNDYKTLLSKHFGETRVTSNDHIAAGIRQIKYSENNNPWCNSLLSTWIYPPDFMDLAPGIGTNIILETTTQEMLLKQGFLLKSHYLLVPLDFLEANQISTNCDVIQYYENDLLCVRTNDGCD